MPFRAVIRWMICAALFGFTAAELVGGLSVQAQSNIVTLSGCTAIAPPSGCSKPVLVDSSGIMQVVGQ